MQDLDNHEVRVEMAEGKASFQMVLPMGPLLAEVAVAIEQMATQAGLMMMKALIDEEVEQVAEELSELEVMRLAGHAVSRRHTSSTFVFATTRLTVQGRPVAGP